MLKTFTYNLKSIAWVSVTLLVMLSSGCAINNTSPLSQQPQQPMPSQNQTKPRLIYVFSQSDLKMMYAMYYMGQLGPVYPPKELQDIVWSYQGRVSMVMLKYAPDSEKFLDQQLIQQVINFSNSGHMSKIKQLPGYELKNFDKSQIPQFHNQTGTIQFWIPVNGQWANWDEPVVKT